MDTHIAPDLKALLHQIQIKDLIKPDKKLVALGHQCTVGHVLETLSSNGILSAPVFWSDAQGNPQTSVQCLIGFVDLWSVLSAFLQSLPATGTEALSAEQLEALGETMCSRSVLSVFEGNAAVKAAMDSNGDVQAACADWELHDDPSSSLLDVIRSCFLPRPPTGSNLTSWQSGAGFSAAMSPAARVPASPGHGSNSNNNGSGSGAAGLLGHSRHPAASHRIVVCTTDGAGQPQLAVLSQSDVLRFMAAHHESLRPLGKASLAELGLATGSLHLAAGPPSLTGRPHSLCTNTTCGPSSAGATTPGGGGHIPSSPKPPLCGGGYGSLGRDSGGGGLLGSLSGIPASPVSDSHMLPAAALLQRAGSGPTAMQMSPPASPRVSAGGGHHLLSLGSVGGGGGHRPAARRQLVAVHESVPVLEAFRVLLQQRVSAVAVLAGSGSSVNMRLVGNLSASDLRHLKAGGFGRLALSVKQFLASKPLAPDQAIPLNTPSSRFNAPAGASGSPAGPGMPPKPPVLMAHAPGVFTCQATASLEELVKMLGAPQHGIHRVYVVDPDQRPAGVVTGTDVLQLLSAACSRD